MKLPINGQLLPGRHESCRTNCHAATTYARQLSRCGGSAGALGVPRAMIGNRPSAESAITSLDGYVEDRRGNFDWAMPDAEVFAFVNDLERPIGTHLYRRRMYETMTFSETAPTSTDQPAVIWDYSEIHASSRPGVARFKRLKPAALSRQILAKTGELETGKCSFSLH